MKGARSIMGMPVRVEIVDASATADAPERVFAFFRSIDERFSPRKGTSEVARLNAGSLTEATCSAEMREVLRRCEETRLLTRGYFDIRRRDGTQDPSGLVKGWAINRAAKLLENEGFRNFSVEAGGDIQVRGRNAAGTPWRIGIRNPFAREQIVQVIHSDRHGVATSGTYERGQHIYDPHDYDRTITDIVSLTVVGPDVYEADRFATAAFAMGREGIVFIEELDGCEGFMIDRNGIAVQTSGFAAFTRPYAAARR